ncbi:MAG: hypothetical protein E4G90_10080 [Gemmatimonadales bacterium]|nr:MAG: hypothetical protein E4G90_10080 [Gemmatimonadales bacterium]
MSESDNNAPTQGGFFSRLFGGSKAGGNDSLGKQTREIKKMLAKAGPTTLNGCSQILTVAIIHEKPLRPEHSAEMLALVLVEKHKEKGWIPSNLRLWDHTPVDASHREDAGSLSESEKNAVLAEGIARVVKGESLHGFVAATFSGDNPALGPTFFSVLAK